MTEKNPSGCILHLRFQRQIPSLKGSLKKGEKISIWTKEKLTLARVGLSLQKIEIPRHRKAQKAEGAGNANGSACMFCYFDEHTV